MKPQQAYLIWFTTWKHKLERCPICRGRVNDEAQCKRCNADLSFVIQAKKDAEDLTQRAITQMEREKYANAERSLVLALSLEHSDIRSKMLAFVRYEQINSNKKVSFLQRITKPFRENHSN